MTKTEPLMHEQVREFGLSHKDFYRIFPRLEPAWQDLGERRVKIERSDGRELEIILSPEHIRQIASLRIPYIDITFRFSGWSEEQRLEFFEKFDLSFQKGGG